MFFAARFVTWPINSLTLRAAVLCKLALVTSFCVICLAADVAGLLEDTSWQCTPKPQTTQVLVNIVSANLASHDLTTATRADGEEEIQELVTGVNRVVHESVCLMFANYTYKWPLMQHVMVILLSKGVKEVALLLIRTLHLCKVFGNTYAAVYVDEWALSGDKDCIWQ